MESAAQIWGQEGGCAVPGSRHTLFVLFCISEPLWAEVGPAVSGSSLAFLTPSIHLSCTPLLCAHCPLNVEGQQASRHLLEPPGGALWDPEMLCGGMSHGGSLVLIMGHKEQVDFTGFRHGKVRYDSSELLR